MPTALASGSQRTLLLGLLLAVSCAPARTTTRSAPADPEAHAVPASPCDDPHYLELRDKPLDAMTPREYEYFTRKDTECSQFRVQRGASAPVWEKASAWPRASEDGPDSVLVAHGSGGATAAKVLGIVALSAVISMAIVAAAVHDIFSGF